LFLENGSMGLRFNPATAEYEKFYQINWPHDTLSMEEVYRDLQRKLPAIFDKVMFRMNECNIGMYVPNRDHYTKKELGTITAALAMGACEALAGFEGHEQVKVIDSGVAAHIIPVDGDKDRGIREFAGILRDERTITIGLEAREILIIGDQPCQGCNDEKLLEGKWGTPFTAEHINPGQHYPIPIFNENGEVLTGPEATLSLLRRVNWSPSMGP